MIAPVSRRRLPGLTSTRAADAGPDAGAAAAAGLVAAGLLTLAQALLSFAQALRALGCCILNP